MGRPEEEAIKETSKDKKKRAQFSTWKGFLTPRSFKVWSRTSTLGITWELVRNAGSDLLPRGGGRTRGPSPRKAPRRREPNLGRAPRSSQHTQRCWGGCGRRAGAGYLSGTLDKPTPSAQDVQVTEVTGQPESQRHLAVKYRTCPFSAKGVPAACCSRVKGHGSLGPLSPSTPAGAVRPQAAPATCLGTTVPRRRSCRTQSSHVFPPRSNSAPLSLQETSVSRDLSETYKTGSCVWISSFLWPSLDR
ncbi:uncharacterized protein LOC130705902 [Balaenoptera acutorostrata]|uniref:Uncharacterized protein LOC130705902 n=1 Tax=Balaenoptera acutorostrata TaxID=9767 RepID=A0ABM3SQP7_BALAC|nr:uncharacterized protein LOC130705902 [Balaenoptera acutorostrata]